MPELALAYQAYGQESRGMPPEVCQNLFARTDAGKRTRLHQVPGLEAKWTGFTGGTARGIFSRDGLLNGDVFVVFGPSVWRVDQTGARTLAATIPDDNQPVRMESSLTELIIVSGGEVWSITAVNAQKVVLSFICRDVSIAGDRFVYVESGTDKVYYSALLDGRTVNALNVFRIGSAPDGIVGVVSYSTDLYFFGVETIEIWSVTSQASAPFVRRPGGVIEQGALSRDGICKKRGKIFFIGNDRLVYVLSGLDPVEISTNAISSKIDSLNEANRSKTALWSHDFDGQTFICLDIPTIGTFVFDMNEQRWHRRKTYNSNLWRVFGAVTRFGNTLVICRDVATVGCMNRLVLTDLSDVIEYEFTASHPLDSGVFPTFKIFLRATYGEGAPVATEAKMLLAFSDDRGRSWTSDREFTLGKRGNFEADGFLTRLGMVRPPGRIYRFRMTDAYPLIVSSVWINEVQA
jgi:hypothetical protein